MRVLSGCFLAVVVTASQLPVAPRSHYAAPGGTRGGDGSQRRPWDLATALAGGGGKVKAGDTVWVRGGVYRGAFRSTVQGAAGKPVVIRQYPGERATIDGAGSRASTLVVGGAYTVFWGLELTNSDPVRTATAVSHDERPDLVVNKASHTKYINLIVHDGGGAFYTEPEFSDVEIAGCIVYNNGWDGPDRGHGHGLYLKSYTGPLVVRDNVVFNQFGYGIHAYTNATTGKLVNIRIEGNISFNNGTLSSDRTNPNILLGGAAIATGDVVKDNVTYFSPGLTGANVRIGYKTLLNGDVRVEGNYFAGGDPVLDVGYWQAAVIAGNTFVGSGTPVKRNQSSAAHIFRNNTEERRPVTTKVIVRRHPYDANRVLIAVLNWGADTTITANLEDALPAGARYEVRSVQNPFGSAIASGTFGGNVRIPLRGSTPSPPEGKPTNRPPRTGAAFDVFLLEKM
jgi:hypothetical protein